MAKSNKNSKLILGQKTEPKEQMNYRDDSSRPDPHVPEKLAARDTPFDKVDFPEKPEGHGTYEEFLASDEYNNALEKLEQYTGERNIGTGIEGKYAQLSNQAMRILQQLMTAEHQHEQELEQLCERVIREYFKIPENALQFNLKLVKEKIAVNNKQKKPQLQQKEEELADDINGLTQERAKRRLINAMTQGHAVDGTWLFQRVSEDLANITGVQDVSEKYSIFVSTMMLGYWQFPEGNLAGAQGEEGGAAGKTRLDTTTKPPTVNAEAMIFPFLIHETIKGVMEFLHKERRPENPELSQRARDLEDSVKHETWDIRLGPAIWRRVMNLFPDAVKNDEDKKKLQFYMLSNIANLPVKEYLITMKEVISGSDDGKKLMGAIYYDLSRKTDNETMTKTESEFRRVIDSLKDKYSEDDLSDLLSSMGIGLSK